MNGERLLPVIRPKILVVDLLPDNITGAAYSSYAWPKPYFTVEKGELIQHNFPVPRTIDRSNADRWRLKQFFGHFAVADRFMRAFFADIWFTSKNSAYIHVDTDPIEVTCRLLKRLKSQTDKRKAILVLYLQFGGGNIRATPEPPPSVQVGDCARNTGILIVDEYGYLRAAYEHDPDVLNRIYHVTSSGLFGHKTSLGNMLVARTLNAALEKAGVTTDSP